MSIFSKIYFFYIKKSRKQKIYIPGYIKQIPYRAFKNNHSIREIYIPESVHTIENEAFSNCISLKKVYFQGNVKNISSKAFSGVRCVELNFVKTIGENDRNRIKSIVRKDKKIFSENVSEVIDKKGDLEEISVSGIKENTEDINVIEIVEPSETT